MILSYNGGYGEETAVPNTVGWWNTENCFGHTGAFSSLAFGDNETGISAAIITNGNRGLNDFARRFISLAQDIRNALQ
jgi:hypothetical protein